MDEKKYTVTTTGEAIMICPECGAKNETGAHNCAYCGRTLVKVTQTDVEENNIRYSKEFLKDDWEQTKKNMGRILNERDNPEAKKEKKPLTAEEKKENEKRKTFLIVAVIIITIVIGIGFFFLLGMINILPGLLMILAKLFFPDSMQSISDVIADNDGLGTLLGILPTLMVPLLFGAFFIIALVIIIIVLLIVIPIVFKQKKSTKNVLKMKCTNCGANNPAGSRTCAYCGNPLIDSRETENKIH